MKPFDGHAAKQQDNMDEEEFYKNVNSLIATKVTPIYNTVILIFAAVFAYFIVIEQNQCYARESDRKAGAVAYANTEDVT